MHITYYVTVRIYSTAGYYGELIKDFGRLDHLSMICYTINLIHRLNSYEYS